MNKTILQVPKGIRLISEYEKKYGFHLEEFPYILDKKIPGCGFTHWCLSNSQNIILASPRKMLMKNKKRQFGDSVFLVNIDQVNTNIDKDLTKFTRVQASATATAFFDRNKLKQELSEYTLAAMVKKVPAKIIVTYDSYRKVKEILEELRIFDRFYTVTDEFQSIFVDGKFKSTTELEFLSAIRDVQRVCFVSATPMMEEYLELIDYFKDLPYYVLDWETLEPSRIKKPKIIVKSLKSINLAAKAIITPYLEGKFDQRLQVNPETGESKNIESKEAVIYVNSVTNIIGIIKSCGLKPDEVCILCSNTPNNQKRISARLDKKRNGLIYKIEEIPLKEEPRKMFTFCTRTVYLGADFYSDNARTFILSDANIDTLAVDITLDLPQILGRQRLACNPWKDEAILYVRPLMKHNALSEEDFNKEIERKLKETRNLLSSYEDTRDEARLSLVNRLERMAQDYNYKDDYVAVNKHAGSFPVPVFNTLVAIAERRAFDIQQKDYADRFTVFSRLVEEGNVPCQELSPKVQIFIEQFYKYPNSQEKFKYLCTTIKDFSNSEVEQIFSEIPDFYKNFYLGLGPDRCRSLGYNFTRMKKEYSTKFFDLSSLIEELKNTFILGKGYSSQEVKSILGSIYSKYGYKKTPKATDLETWFKVKEIKVKSSDGKWNRGIKIIGMK